MKNAFLILFALTTLNGCASIADGQTQNVTIRTPGAENARCVIENQDLKYVAYTNQTLEMKKSPHDLMVHCKASGNREQMVHVKRGISPWVSMNAAHGFVPGATYDYFSRGGFTYPDVIEVNFVGLPARPYPLPEHLRNDSVNNEFYNRIEYQGPTLKETEETRYEAPPILQKKTNLYESYQGVSSSAPAYSSGSSLDSIHRQYNPHVVESTEEDK